MRNALLYILLLLALPAAAQNNIGIGTAAPDASALLDLTSSQKGFLVPRVTTAQRNAIVSPANGLLVYDLNLNCFFYYNSSVPGWISLCQSALGATGATGATGITGPSGATGTNGAAGAQGATGLQGIAGATGVTGPSGIDGTNGAAGAQGATGLQGIAGATGATGVTGPSGIDGTNGAAGAQGPTGLQGIAGTTGATGVTGPSGIDGTNGAAGAQGPTGLQGIAGATGATGVTGPSGNNGTNGAAGAQGATGLQGIAGATGATGVTGPSGNNGTNGAAGAQGATGLQGIAGATGATGVTGPSGNNGTNGAAGAQGATGLQGIAGATGATGVTGPSGNNGTNGAVGAQGATGLQGIAGATGATGVTGPTGPLGAAGGDLTGTYPNPVVSGLQTTPISATAPTSGQILQFNGTQWVPATYTGAFWNLLGNSGTNAASNFLGTIDGIDLVIKTASTERARVLASNGNVGIGIALPLQPLHVYRNSNNNKYSIFGEARQTQIGANYLDVGVGGYGSGQNLFSGYAVGVHGTADQPNSGIAIGVLAALGNGGMSTIPSNVDAALYADGNNYGFAGIFMRGLSGFYADDPYTVVDVAGDVAHRGYSLNFNTGNNNNIDINTLGTNKFSYYEITPAANAVLTGFNGGTNGRIVTLVNVGSVAFSIAHNSASSSIGNKINTPTNAAITVPAGGAVTLQYGVTNPNWYVISNTSSDWQLTGNANTNPATNFVGTTDAQDLVIRTANTERIRTDVNGRVGIGTGPVGIGVTSTVSKLEILGDATYSDVVHRVSGAQPWYSFQRSQGTLAAPTIIGSQGVLGRINFAGYDGTTHQTAALIAAEVDGASGAGDMPGRLIFSLAVDNSTTLKERMRMTNYGYIGMNTKTPQAHLHVVDTPGGTMGAVEILETEAAASTLDFRNAVNGHWITGTNDNGNGTNNNQYIIHNFNDGQTFLAVQRGTGYVGIGNTAATQAPAAALDIENSATTSPTPMLIVKNGGATGTQIKIGAAGSFLAYTGSIDWQNNSFSIALNSAASFDLQLGNNSAAKPTGGSWTVPSDRRLKEDIHPFKDGLEVLRQIQPVYFKYTGEAGLPKEYGIGVIAQEVQQVAPYMTSTWEYLEKPEDRNSVKKFLSYNPDALFYLLLNAVKDLDQKQSATLPEIRCSDFGTAVISSKVVRIHFATTFAEKMNDNPVVVATPLNSNVQLSISNISAEGFDVTASGDSSKEIAFNWIAMANAKKVTSSSNYSKEERDELIKKVKLPEAKIR
ncbi:MAG: tail fiber domain-containing protein [Chitinophagales bacterium]